MGTRNARTVAAAAIVVCAVALSGCSGSSGSKSSSSKSPTPSKSSAAGGKTLSKIRTHKTAGLGPVLVDGAGRTLYLFKKDTSAKPNCKGACAKAWPPAVAKGKPSAGSGAKAGLLGTATGGRQVTYKGHPLYYYAADGKPGDAKGQGSKAFGAGWYVLDGAGGTVTKKAKSGSGSGGGSSSGGGGY